MNDNCSYTFLFPFQDCHGSLTANPAPIQDDTQNYMIDSGYQNATHTQVRISVYKSSISKISNVRSLHFQIQFRRVLETCDPHDVTLSVSCRFIIKTIVLFD